ncbi:MAG: DUF4114 domain-containing protein [Alphaproteobacteria bacterium]|nr:DUF4114 domain-containing protein [Alphaproteobacteria bacterium SS10]
MVGTNEDDNITGKNTSDVMSGRAGDDSITGQNGNDEIWGGTGDDTLRGNNGNDIVFGSGGPNIVDVESVEITDDYDVSVIFEGETAGYKNTFGTYKVQEDETITDVEIIWPNASLRYSGGDLVQGVSREYLDVEAGDQISFFIVSNGYNLNGRYNDVDLEAGALEFRDADGEIATLNSINPDLIHVAEDGTETEIRVDKYHTAAFGEHQQLNADGLLHTAGILKPDAGTLTIGFEDLYNGGDRDFDDSVFTVDIGTVNAQVLNAHYQTGNDDEDPDTGDGDGDDDVVIIPPSDNDHLYGGNGADELHGRSGNDKLEGDNGNDALHGGSGDDQAVGESGDDTVFGNSGNDNLSGGQGRDSLGGNSGDDVINGDSQDDTIIGGHGQDTLDGGNHDDLVIGGSGDDYLIGGYGDDTLKGGAGEDTLSGGHGDDDLQGGHGDDTFIADAGDDSFHGGRGVNTVDYSDYDNDLRILLHNKKAHGLEIGNDYLKYIQNAISGDGDDSIKGSKEANELIAGGGDDRIRSLGGEDTLTGGSGDDIFEWRSYDIDGDADIITDFDLNDDAIDLRHVMKNAETDDEIIARLNVEDTDDGALISVRKGGTGDGLTDLVILQGIDGEDATSLFDAGIFIV